MANRGRTLPAHSCSLGGGCLHRPQLCHCWKSFPLDCRVLQPRDTMPALSALSHLPAAVPCPASDVETSEGVPALIHRPSSSPAELCWLVRTALPLGSWLCGSPCSWKVVGVMQRAEGQGQVGTTAAGSEKGGSISDHSRGGRWGRRGGCRRGR